ncbi:PilN family type IVB pilus formation outer membrane protein [Buttiauxella sp. B2]|uniref:PilN family type IVB pilus formation outer membrane protein n=1 Tax=Buttiauxella sp. B2 TaxID=2587812 RepID=UPI00112331AF|nr:PilN family type IVB pilus formation outer membrane protein [Buttiauxella sp. B2]TNV16098.1 PilN family type IVB pilus formation outer membrane protein [Buttiauxella sp. B2]
MKIKYLVYTLSVFLLSGCAVQRINDSQDRAINKENKVDSLLKDVNSNRPVATFHETQWVNPVPMVKPQYSVPPEVARCQITYKTMTAQDVYQFSQDITQQCNIRTSITPDAVAMLTGGGGESGSTTKQLTDVPPPMFTSGATPPGAMQPLSSFGSSPNISASGRSSGSGQQITGISYSGLLPGLLDAVTARLGISWKYENNAIKLFYLETKRFDIDPSDAKYTLDGQVSSGISNQSGGSSSGGSDSSGGVSGQGGSSSSSTSKMGNSLYEDLLKTSQAMLTPGVGRVAMNQTTGTVIVTDVPEVVKNIGDYLTKENASLSKQILFKVVIYTINNEANDTLGIDWNLVFKSLGQNYGINLSNTFNAGTDAVSGGFSILDTATGTTGQWAGSSILLNALSQQVNVADVKTSSIITTNMASAPVLVGQQTTYLKSVSVTATGGSDGSTQQALEPGSVTTGTNITIFPKVLEDNRIMMNMFIDISSLKQLRQLKSDTQTIEGPDQDTRAIQPRVWIKPGETLILSGFEQNTDDVTKQGVGSPNNIFFGGGMKGKKVKQSFVITVTPFLH